MTLALRFPAGPIPSMAPSTIYVVGIPSNDPADREEAERVARLVLAQGWLVPHMMRVSWDEILEAGQACGLLVPATPEGT